MRKYDYLLSFIAGAAATYCFTAFSQTSFIKVNAKMQKIAVGRESYVRNCSGCHGMTGEGDGAAAAMLSPKPRNFVTGSFKFRTTPSGSMPTDDDLMRTLVEGVHGTSMPSFRLHSGEELRALIAYIKSLKRDWSEYEADPIHIPPTPSYFKDTESSAFLASALTGKELYMAACHTCHGDTGLGDGPSSEGLLDGENQPIRPASLQRAFIKGGYGARDVYRAISTGLDGTPMPAFADAYTPEQRWNLVSYVFFLRGKGMGIYPQETELKTALAKVDANFAEKRKAEEAASESSDAGEDVWE